MIGLISIILAIAPFLLFIFGMILTRRLSFTGGFYFCLIMLIHYVYSLIAPLFINNYIDNIASRNILFGLSMGELIVVITFIPRIIELIALSFLMYGFYHIWKKAEASKLNH